MNCRNCGAVVGQGANFCAICGSRIAYGAAPVQPVTGFVRPHEGRALAGVCAGLSWYFGWDVALVRILAVIAAILTFPLGILVYLAAWMIVPDAPLYVVQPMAPPVQHQQT